MSFDLSTQYGGLFLHSPVVVSASPLAMDEQTRAALETAGAGAIVLPSIFEEQVIQWAEREGQLISKRDEILLKRSNRVCFPGACQDAESYLALVNRASAQLAIPVIASLNGYTASGWLDFAGKLQEAGAAGIELNVHQAPIDEFQGSNEIENRIIDAIAEVKQAISIPLFVKLQRGYLSIPHLARRACSGADGFVLHGRQPDTDICLDTLRLNTTWSLSPPGNAVQLIAPIMRTHRYCPAMSIAASGGIATCEDLIKVLLAGADVAMVTSEIYRRGPDVIRTLIDGLVVFLEKHHFQSLRGLQLQRPIEFDDDQERVAYINALSSRIGTERPPTDTPPTLCDRYGHPVGRGARQ